MTTPWGDRPAFIDPVSDDAGLEVGEARAPAWFRLAVLVLLVLVGFYAVSYKSGAPLDTNHDFQTGREAGADDPESGAATP